MGCRNVEWIHLAQDKIRCTAIVNTVILINIRFQRKVGKF